MPAVLVEELTDVHAINCHHQYKILYLSDKQWKVSQKVSLSASVI